MEKQGGDFNSIQMKILIKIKDDYMNILQNSDNNPDWALELMNFFKKIYNLTFDSVQKLNRSSHTINRHNLDKMFNSMFKNL